MGERERETQDAPEDDSQRMPSTSAGSTGQTGQSSVDTPGFSRTGLKERRQGLTDPSRDWPGPDDKEAIDGE
jgi:hypothetical protein